MTTRRVLAAIFLVLLFASNGHARADGKREDILKLAELNMLLSGTIDVSPDGSVVRYRIDQADKLTPVVTGLIDTTVSNWRFRPVEIDGQPALVRARMGLNIVATNAGHDKLALRVDSASFGELGSDDGGKRIVGKSLPAPIYPFESIRNGTAAIAYVLLKIGPNGRVIDSVVEQVNLTAIGTATMKNARRPFIDAVKSVVRKWRFIPPTQGEQADKPYWVVRVPVDFRSNIEYGQWMAYLPGPRATAPWDDRPQDAAFKPDAMLAGMAYTSDSSLELLTPLGN